jgi:hypothetical protein
MNIKNEDHAAEMLKEWQNLPETARKRQVKTAIEKLELSSMYYEQKGNEKGAARAERCIVLLKTSA